jgi:hypothetical protein
MPAPFVGNGRGPRQVEAWTLASIAQNAPRLETWLRDLSFIVNTKRTPASHLRVFQVPSFPVFGVDTFHRRDRNPSTTKASHRPGPGIAVPENFSTVAWFSSTEPAGYGPRDLLQGGQYLGEYKYIVARVHDLTVFLHREKHSS